MLGLSWAHNAYYFNNFRFFLDETEKKGKRRDAFYISETQIRLKSNLDPTVNIPSSILLFFFYHLVSF